MRIGSLCSGYGGLDLGVQRAIGGTVAWHVEYDDAPSRILAHHAADGDAACGCNAHGAFGCGASGLNVGTVAGSVHRDRAGDSPSGVHVVGGTAGVVAWGVYAPAIRRWERVLGRPAPDPTEPGRNGPRLSPAFVEWLMGLDPGHVTDPAIGLTRNQQLKSLGNGVVPLQCALALRLLLGTEAVA